jgi:hypothetical protein
MATIEHRKRILVNTDPQRRCYDGCHFSSELQWTEWDDLESGLQDDRIEDRLEFWRGLNDYAVEARGQSARSEYRVKKESADA